jgi:hypothetical protein
VPSGGLQCPQICLSALLVSMNRDMYTTTPRPTSFCEKNAHYIHGFRLSGTYSAAGLRAATSDTWTCPLRETRTWKLLIAYNLLLRKTGLCFAEKTLGQYFYDWTPNKISIFGLIWRSRLFVKCVGKVGRRSRKIAVSVCAKWVTLLTQVFVYGRGMIPFSSHVTIIF